MRAGHGGAVTAVAVSPDGTCIASGSADATVKVWRATDGALLRTLTASAFQTTALAFAPNANILAAGGYDGSVKLWNMTNATLIRSLDVVWTNNQIGRTYTNHPGKVCAIAFSPDGQKLVSGSGDWVTRVWRVADGILLTNRIRQVGGILSVAFSPDGATVALGSEDKSIVLLRTSDWGYLRTLTHNSNVTAVAFSPTEPILASASLDRTIRFWRTTTWDLDRSLTNHTRGITSLAFAVDGSRLISGDQGGVLKVWSASLDWNEASSWPGHIGAAFSMSALADNLRLVSAGQDHAVNIWQISDGQCLRTLTEHHGMITRIPTLRMVRWSPRPVRTAPSNSGMPATATW
jgi:WD40 repeat protein